MLLAVFFGNLLATPYFFLGKGGSEGPPCVVEQAKFLVCGSLIVLAAVEPEKTDFPPFSVEFLHNPNCHMNYSNYL